MESRKKKAFVFFNYTVTTKGGFSADQQCFLVVITIEGSKIFP